MQKTRIWYSNLERFPDRSKLETNLRTPLFYQSLSALCFTNFAQFSGSSLYHFNIRHKQLKLWTSRRQNWCTNTFDSHYIWYILFSKSATYPCVICVCAPVYINKRRYVDTQHVSTEIQASVIDGTKEGKLISKTRLDPEILQDVDVSLVVVLNKSWARIDTADLEQIRTKYNNIASVRPAPRPAGWPNSLQCVDTSNPPITWDVTDDVMGKTNWGEQCSLWCEYNRTTWRLDQRWCAPQHSGNHVRGDVHHNIVETMSEVMCTTT